MILIMIFFLNHQEKKNNFVQLTSCRKTANLIKNSKE